MRCEHQPDVVALSDGDLDEGRAADVREHITICPDCQGLMRSLERLSAVLQATHVAVEMPAPKREALRQRVMKAATDSLTAETSAPALPQAPQREGWWERWRWVWPPFWLSPVWQRRALALGASLAFVGLLLFLLVKTETPAQALGRTLNAMAMMRSAHGEGWFTSYQSADPIGRPIPGRLRVEYWYQSPDKFQRDLLGPEVEGWDMCPQQLIMTREQAVYIGLPHVTRTHAYPRSVVKEKSRAEAMRRLSPFDFFSPEGIIRKAMRKKGAQVTRVKSTLNDRSVNVVTLQVEEGTSRQRWVLHVDPPSDIVLRSEWTWEEKMGSFWQPMFKETLEHFEYASDMKGDLFQVH